MSLVEGVDAIDGFSHIVAGHRKRKTEHTTQISIVFNEKNDAVTHKRESYRGTSLNRLGRGGLVAIATLPGTISIPTLSNGGVDTACETGHRSIRWITLKPPPPAARRVGRF